MVRVSSGKNSNQSYGTPKYLFNYFSKLSGGFTLDAAASEENALCPRFYTEEYSGLFASWIGETVWLNPPFNNVAEWAEKSIYEVLENDCLSVWMLLNNDCGVDWYKKIWNSPAVKIHYLIGHRVRYIGAKHSQSVSSVCIRIVKPVAKFQSGINDFRLVEPHRPSFRERILIKDREQNGK